MQRDEIKRSLIPAAVALLLTSGFVAALVFELDRPPVNAGMSAGTTHPGAAQAAPVRNVT